jgi:NADP-dependent 3-hydroxy acid dehydrogenase YdfG
VSRRDEVERMFAALDSAWGGVDVLLDNAGVDGKRMLSRAHVGRAATSVT